MRHGKDTIEQANRLIAAMQNANQPKFEPTKFRKVNRDDIQDLINKAKRYTTIQERWCSEEMSDGVRSLLEGKETGLQNDIRAIASRYDLRVHFDGDPRGYCVKLHTIRGDVYNTWGGKESGYGIG